MNDLRLQDPTAILDHPVDWSDWLQTGETITTATFSITPSSGVTLSGSSHTDTTSTVTVAGLAQGAIYRLSHHIATSVGREDTRSLTIRGFSE